MNVLSLFDGMSCGRIALERAGIHVDNYYASEIDKYAIKVSKANYPDIIQLGDINGWKEWNLPKIDLILAGSPCQGFSFAGKQLAFDDPRSKLFFTFMDIATHHSHKDLLFLLENVKMKKEYQDTISMFIGCEPIEIDSALVSAQSRRRNYWTNIPVKQPEDRGIYLKDIVLPDVLPVEMDGLRGKNGCFGEGYARVYTDKSTTLRTPSGGGNIPSFVLTSLCSIIKREIGGVSVNSEGIRPYQKDDRKSGVSEISRALFESAKKSGALIATHKQYLIHTDKAIDYMDKQVEDGRTHWDFGHHSDIRKDKSAVVVANFFKGVPYNVFKDWDCVRKFHPVECERLQTVPDNYTNHVSNTQRYKMLGNGWTVDVIVHILKGILV